VNAGRLNQGTKGVAIGDRAGESNQGEAGVAIGGGAGKISQNVYAISIGQSAGTIGQHSNAIAIGRNAASDTQGSYAIAIGDSAGVTSQGENAIAIGRNAARTQGFANTIVLNASGGDLNPVATDSVYIKNFRNSTTQHTNVLSSNLTSGEVITSSMVVSGSNVGLGGNTSPQHELAVDGNTYSNIITHIIRFDDGAGDEVIEGLTFLDVTQNGNSTTETVRFNHPTTSLVTASNVGIGTTTPSTRLEVVGTVTATAYAPFTGMHFVTRPTDKIVPDGTIMVSTGRVERRSTIDTVVEVTPSTFMKQKTVLGVSHYDIETGRTDVISLGEGLILVCKQNGPILNGDYICSSGRKGIGMRQSDDILHSYTVAKATEECLFENGERQRLVACTFHCG
jgi:hypothetical protein